MATIYKPAGKSKYIIEYTNENGKRCRKTGATDKGVTQRIANDLENRVALRREGLIDPKAESFKTHDDKPLVEHLDAWTESLEAKGTTPKHAKLFSGRGRRIVALLMGAKLAEIEPASDAKRVDIARAEANLTKWVTSARLSDLTPERVQKALAMLKMEGRSLATCNHHRAAIKAFSKWCFDTHRAREDALRGVAGFNAKEDRRHDRRTVSLDELHRLVEAAQHGPEVMGLSGPARSLCYRLAVATGLRYSEIASIAPTRSIGKPPASPWTPRTRRTAIRPQCRCRSIWWTIWPPTWRPWTRTPPSSPYRPTRVPRCSVTTWKPPASSTKTPRDNSSTSIRCVARWRPTPMPPE